ncbi:MAG: SpoIIE family protein phosphatase, partial [Rudaea sp.]
IVERLNAETAPIAFRAAMRGVRVFAQLDTIFRGRDVALQLGGIGVPPEQLAGLRWIVSISRLRTLCPNCRQPDTQIEPAIAAMLVRYPDLAANGKFFKEGRCEVCGRTGRKGEVTAFDVFQASGDVSAPFEGNRLLTTEDYVMGLAAEGLVPLSDVLQIDARQLQSTYQLLTGSEQALGRANAALNSKVAELEAANRVLKKQTQAAISLEEVTHALISYSTLEELGNYVCRKAGELCGADCALLYLLRPDDTAEILSFTGWKPETVSRQILSRAVFNAGGSREEWTSAEPRPFFGWPPGVEKQEPDVTGMRVRGGLRVPLIAQGEPVGLLIFHSTTRASWHPRDIALLSAFANSSALAIQRAGLVDALRDKIAQLESAQAEIAKKERLERELELARQVQESMLPHIFPLVPGLRFAARSRPARQVGGDFYDVFPLDASRCGLVIADVSDKGMPAALFMALTRSLILAEARREDSPSVVLQRVHRLLRELSQSDQYVTVFYAVADGAALTLTYVRAGHEHPLLFRQGSAISIGGRGSFIGALDADELPLVEERMELHHGDRLVLYTDGLTDALSPQYQPFGLERLTEALNSHADSSLEEMCGAAFDSVIRHQAASEQYDDMTLLAVEVT